jgi:anti-anti-sigma factor
LLRDVDVVTVVELGKVSRKVLDSGVRAIVLDMARFGFFDSRGVNFLLEIADQCDSRGVDLSVMPSRHIARILEVMGLSDHFKEQKDPTGSL